VLSPDLPIDIPSFKWRMGELGAFFAGGAGWLGGGLALETFEEDGRRFVVRVLRDQFAAEGLGQNRGREPIGRFPHHRQPRFDPVGQHKQTSLEEAIAQPLGNSSLIIRISSFSLLAFEFLDDGIEFKGCPADLGEFVAMATPSGVDDLEVFRLEALDGGQEISVAAQKEGNIVAAFPSEAEHVGDDTGINGLFRRAAKVGIAVRAVGEVCSAGAAVNRMLFPMTFDSKDTNAGLLIEEVVEPIFEFHLATWLIRGVNAGFFQ
jgi:hypothetical protein